MILSKARLTLAGWNFHPRVRERCWKRLGRQLETAHLPLKYCFHLLEERAIADKSPLALVYATIGARLARGYSVGAAIASFASSASSGMESAIITVLVLRMLGINLYGAENAVIAFIPLLSGIGTLLDSLVASYANSVVAASLETDVEIPYRDTI